MYDYRGNKAGQDCRTGQETITILIFYIKLLQLLIITYYINIFENKANMELIFDV